MGARVYLLPKPCKIVGHALYSLKAQGLEPLALTPGMTLTPRVQVPNNHILSRILTYITTTLNPSTLLLGPLDPWGYNCRVQQVKRSVMADLSGCRVEPGENPETPNSFAQAVPYPTQALPFL